MLDTCLAVEFENSQVQLDSPSVAPEVAGPASGVTTGSGSVVMAPPPAGEELCSSVHDGGGESRLAIPQQTDALQEFLDMDHQQLAVIALQRTQALDRVTAQRDGARATLRAMKQQFRKYKLQIQKTTLKQAKKDAKKINTNWLSIGKRNLTKDFSWITTSGLLSIGIRRNLSSASSRGFGLAAGCAVSRQAVWAYKTFPSMLVDLNVSVQVAIYCRVFPGQLL